MKLRECRRLGPSRLCSLEDRLSQTQVIGVRFDLTKVGAHFVTQTESTLTSRGLYSIKGRGEVAIGVVTFAHSEWTLRGVVCHLFDGAFNDGDDWTSQLSHLDGTKVWNSIRRESLVKIDWHQIREVHSQIGKN